MKTEQKTAEQIAEEAWEKYLQERKTDAVKAWNQHQKTLRDAGIIASVGGYRFAE